MTPSACPVLTTNRLRLRSPVADDRKEIFDLRSNPAVNQYLNRKPCNSIADAVQFIEQVNANNQKNDSYYWGITLTAANQLIGVICLFNFSEDRREVEIGFELLPSFQGQGIMQEALVQVIYFATVNCGVHTITAHCHPGNHRSIRLLEKTGFKKVAQAQQDTIAFHLDVGR